jgi:glucosamine-6-phosphate deaminase
MIKLEIYPTSKTASKIAAEVFARQLNEKAESVFGLSGGRTFIHFYYELVKICENREAPFSKMRSFQVCEFLGLPGTHPLTHRFFLVDNFFDHVPAPRRFQKRLPGLPINTLATCKDFEERIKKVGGLDLVVLTIGYGDWLGFNERGTPFNSVTHEVTLSEELKNYYTPLFPRGSVPRRGITMGIKTILSARQILVLVTGEHKSQALKRMIESDISPQIPSTALKTHENVLVIADAESASAIKTTKKKTGSIIISYHETKTSGEKRSAT